MFLTDLNKGLKKKCNGYIFDTRFCVYSTVLTINHLKGFFMFTKARDVNATTIQERH